MAGYETAVVRLRRGMSGQLAGLGVLVGRDQVVTCAHVVNTALGRGQRDQAAPGEQDNVLVDFPLLDDGTVRVAHVAAWMPPPSVGNNGGDVAGLVLTEKAPDSIAAARFMAAPPEPGTSLRVFGYPRSPARGYGTHVDVTVKGEVGHRVLQVETKGDQSVKVQPGFSGSPVWDHATGKAVGLLQVAPLADEPERDAYLLAPLTIAQAWEEPFDYLLVPENPYRGLGSFTAKDTNLFFGRDRDIRELASRVRRQPVVVVVGPSGVGKSSLVQAGLIPALQRGQRWSTTVIRPGQDPWTRLAAGLLRAEQGTGTGITRERCEREVARLRREGLGPTARFLRDQDRPLLLVIDQFEEALADDMRTDESLLDLLLPPAGDVEHSARVVLTLRTDFLRVLQSIPGSHLRLNDRLYLLSPLAGEDLREAVEQPAITRGVGFEPGLIDLIIGEAKDTTLPVLQFALTRLWETQLGKTLTFAGHRDMGGVGGALDRFAQDRASQLAEATVEIVDRTLLRLVRVPVGNPELATRNRVMQSQIPAEEWQILQRLSGAWLVTLGTDPATGEFYADLAHEALITAWQRLSSLASANAEFLNWLSWVQQRATDGDPLPDDRIAEARQWLTTRPGEIPATVSRFVERSETTAEAKLRELRDARDHAETALKRAEEAQRRAEALRLAADAELSLRTGPSFQTALALSVESLLTMPTAQGNLALRHVLRIDPAAAAQGRLVHDRPVVAVAFSPDGTRLATASYDRSARVFDAATGTELARLSHDGHVVAVAFSPDGTRLATASVRDLLATSFDATAGARVFDAATGAELARLAHDGVNDGDRGSVREVIFSPDGTRVATASGHLARVFDAATGTELARLVHDGHVGAVAFSPDGTRVATASGDEMSASVDATAVALVFDATTGAELTRLGHDATVTAVAFSPDGTRIATSSWYDSVRVFDAATGAELVCVRQDGRVRGVVFSPDGTRIATDSWRDGVRVFDAATGTELVRLYHPLPVGTVVFSPDGTRIATSSGRSARVFDAATGTELAIHDHDDTVHAVVFSPDGTRVASCSHDHTARIFEVEVGPLIQQALQRLKG